MRKRAMLATAIVASLFVSLATSSSIGATAPAQKGAKAERFAVVQIGEEIKVVKKSELTSLSKTVAEENKRQQKAYEDFKKNKSKAQAQGKSKGKGKDAEMGAGMGIGLGMGRDADQAEMSKPAKRSVKILKNSLKTEQEAMEYKEKTLEDRAGTKTGKKADAW